MWAFFHVVVGIEQKMKENQFLRVVVGNEQKMKENDDKKKTKKGFERWSMGNGNVAGGREEKKAEA